jgi:hypothetical protein
MDVSFRVRHAYPEIGLPTRSAGSQSFSSYVFAPLFTVEAAMSQHPVLFALFEILIFTLLGGEVSIAIVLLAEELPIE